ncbi:MAG: hypothetical protein P1U65_10595 [Minwuia sp.]|nr:hypothetical protein [Minwuia sp.]
MRGELISVLSEMWCQFWKKLAYHKDASSDTFCDLYRELNTPRVVPLDPATELADIVDDREQARVGFRDTEAAALKDEVVVLEFLERARTVIEDFGSKALTNQYFNLVRDLLDRYSLRYVRRRPFSLHLTLRGLFARLVRDLRQITSQDSALAAPTHDFKGCVRDLKDDQSARKIKQCFASRFNLPEALRKQHPDFVAYNSTAKRATNTFEAMCDKTITCPNEAIKDSAKGIHRLAGDQPGIRHSGNQAGKLRRIDMRDLISVTILLAGFSPYFSQAFSADAIGSG